MRSAAHIDGHPIHPMLIVFPFAYLFGSACVDAWPSSRIGGSLEPRRAGAHRAWIRRIRRSLHASRRAIVGTVQCPWHGSQFDVISGRVEKGPAADPVASYPVEEHSGRVMIVLDDRLRSQTSTKYESTNGHRESASYFLTSYLRYFR
jgi:hypothetical protein